MIRVGQRLHEARTQKGLTLQEVSKATKIRESFLMAIETGDFKSLPSSAYILGFVKNYAEFLGLPQKEIIALFKREFNEKEFVKVLPEGFAKKGDIAIRSFRLSQAGMLLLGVFMVLFVYLAFQYKYLFLNPSLSVEEPKEGGTYSSEIIVKGKTDPNATVYINSAAVRVDKNGGFTKEIHVFPGVETITIKSQNRIGKEATVERHITVIEE